jgi:uncharacterized protein (DUF1015 family)
MAVVAPFRALRYNPARISSIENVVTPPYDVISPRRQEEFYQADQRNIIRLDLNKEREEDDAGNNRYARSAGHLAKWMEEEVLLRDPEPAFYPVSTTFSDPEGGQHLRHGFFTLMKVENYGQGAVLPHEKTFSATKEDRLKLLKATQCNISPIFAIFPDDDSQVEQALDRYREKAPLHKLVDPDGQEQILGRVSDPRAIAEISKLMADKVIFIADGHHRYETSMAYRDYMRGQYPDAPANASFNYVMVYLCAMSDPGLLTLGCHRMINRLSGFDARDFLALASPYFTHREIPLGPGVGAAREQMMRLIKQGQGADPTFGLVARGSGSLFVITLRQGVMDNGEWPDLPAEMKSLDVEVLTHVVLEKILGLDEIARDREHLIAYRSDTEQVIDEVLDGDADLAFLLNPTLVTQVQAVAEAGLVMPRKSTYFFPKALSGLAMNLVDPNEVVG